jgi:hypothetical protein
LLREAHEACIEGNDTRPDELDTVVQRLLETPKTLKLRDNNG